MKKRSWRVCKHNFIFRLAVWGLAISLVCPFPALAQQSAFVLNLPQPGSMVEPSPAYAPLLVKGLRVHADNPLLFDFVIDPGDDLVIVSEAKQSKQEHLRIESERLIKYFLACLTIPEEDLWVNLSPYEKDRMIPQSLGQTELGRDMLAQDYILKQLTSSLIYPEKQLGKEFWDRVYKKAQAMYGTTQIPVNTFNKVWVLADTAKVYEHKDTAYLVNSHLKVMLDEDYTARNASLRGAQATKQSNSVASQVIREIILPEIEKEVNQGKNFAPLRQIFNSFILATWYKQNLKQALLNQVYANKAKVSGLSYQNEKNLSFPNVFVGNPEQIYQRYLQAYKKGVFNYIKEESVIPESFSRESNKGTTIPRKYFSGGARLRVEHLTRAQASAELSPAESADLVRLRNKAMLIATRMDKQSAAMAVKPRILLVEDDIMLGPTLKENLEFEGYDVTLAVNKESALQALNGDPAFDLILSDKDMPNIGDGVDLFTALAASKWANMPFILMSGRVVDNDSRIPRSSNLKAVVGKPFYMDKVLNILKAWVPLNIVTEQKKLSEINIAITEQPTQVGEYMARELARLIEEKNKKGESALVIIPIGNTAIPLYREFINLVIQRNIDLSKVYFANMDEYYVGIEWWGEHQARRWAESTDSFRYFMNQHFYGPLERAGRLVQEDHIIFFEGDLKTPEMAIERYKSKLAIAKAEVGDGIDLVLGGIGSNNHIAFNEPRAAGTPVEAFVTGLVELAPSTLKDNFPGKNEADILKRALTIGFDEINHAKRIIIGATGENKANAVSHTVGEVTAEYPSSLLPRDGRVTLVLNPSAAGKLSNYPDRAMRVDTGLRKVIDNIGEIEGHFNYVLSQQLPRNIKGKRRHFFDTYLLSIKPNPGYAIGIDFSGTNLRMSWVYVDLDGNVRLVGKAHEAKWDDKDRNDPNRAIAKIAAGTKILLRQAPAGVDTKKNPVPVGVALGFPMEQTSRMDAKIPGHIRVIKKFKLHKLKEGIIPLYEAALVKEGIKDQVDANVVLNDGVAVLNRIPGAIMSFINGTGIGGAVVIDGKIYNGEWGALDIPKKFKTKVDLGYIKSIPLKRRGNALENIAAGPGLAEIIVRQLRRHLPKGSAIRDWLPKNISKDKDWQGEFIAVRDILIKTAKGQYVGPIRDVDADLFRKAFQQMGNPRLRRAFSNITTAELNVLLPVVIETYQRSALIWGALIKVNLDFADPQRKRFNEQGWVIPWDGSTTEKIPFFQEWMKGALMRLMNLRVQDIDFRGIDTKAVQSPGRLVFVNAQKPTVEGTAATALSDKAQIISTGGIDLKRADLKMDVEKQDGGIHLVMDQVMLARFQAGDFSGVKPVILQIIPAAGQLNSLDI